MNPITLPLLSADGIPPLRSMLNDDTPEEVQLLGNSDFLKSRKLAFFCSQQCPGSVLAMIYDLAQILSQKQITLVGGFQSPVEEEFLLRLLKCAPATIICPARNLENMQVKPEWQEAVQQGRILFLSAFPTGNRRISRHLAVHRNRFVAAIADEVLVAYASEQGAVHRLCTELQSWPKKKITLSDAANDHLFELGFKPIRPMEIE